MSDMAGKAAREAVEPSGSERDTMLLAADLNRANGMSEIEGKADEGSSERAWAANEFQRSWWDQRHRTRRDRESRG